MADRVFIADYIKKKRRRKGNLEYLVKWKGYPTRHCTWEPRENILDASLIKQFDEEGYDPRRVRAACRKKKRRRSEITESRSLPLPFYDSDSEHEPRTPPHDLLSKHKTKVSPISLSKFGGVWQADATSEERDTLFENEADKRTGQKKRKIELDIIDNKENEVTLHSPRQEQLSPLYENGGKSCHPKMRAKYMFRTGDFENTEWGYDWSSSDNESLKGIVHIDSEKALQSTMTVTQNNPENRKRLDSYCEMSSNASESTIPAIDELEVPPLVIDHDWQEPAGCPSLENSYFEETFSPIKEEDENMPTLTNEHAYPDPEKYNLTQQPEMDQSYENVTPEVNTDKAREHVYVTEVTLDNLTVIIHESDKMKGFFRYQT
ncbi:chromobox protein homolog 8-like [Ruditapes philippinarum]|uniref:chromobox protein homolog 8-like n=1 Tax=Ruditapes philippinarum TaxID=129788 RepID=UPI00295BEE14|nr:chromobox protein homolog 8-like [Ruditapes philippinarum]